MNQKVHLWYIIIVNFTFIIHDRRLDNLIQVDHILLENVKLTNTKISNVMNQDIFATQYSYKIEINIFWIVKYDPNRLFNDNIVTIKVTI